LRKVVDQPDPALSQDVDDLVDCLTGAAIPQRDLVAELTEREAACDLLTRDQADVLDRLQFLDRVEIRGGAGSGKTWLAVEKARRLAASGQRVALMCYSRGLAEFLRRRVATLRRRERPAYVGTFHYLGIGWGVPAGSDDDSGYWEEFLPERMVSLAGELPESERFDAIVVDEGQDFAQSWWAAVLAALKDPENGSLYVFADEGQRVFARQGRPTVDLIPIPLNENLRNTKQIAGTFSSLAPEQMRIRGQSGVPVRFVQCATEDAVGVADDAADALLEEGWPPESVALLTTFRRHPVQVERQAEGQDAYWATYWDDEDLFYGHVLGFKGLERPAVVLAVNGFRDEARAREMLYVGLSRARDLLVVCGDLELIRRVGGEAVARRLTGPHQ
jgi:superfamily I DNA/RNA helicase